MSDADEAFGAGRALVELEWGDGGMFRGEAGWAGSAEGYADLAVAEFFYRLREPFYEGEAPPPEERTSAFACSRARNFAAAAADESDYPEHLEYYKHEDTRAMLRRYSNAWWLLGFLALASNFETVAEGLRYEENE